MNSLRKWLYKPKKTDTSLLAQFYFVDEDLNSVAAELDSFDGRKDPERCTMLVNQLRVCQDKVLTVIQRIMEEAIPQERANRDFRVKFPDDVLQESLAGQLWFGAECLAAGSSILNREVESASMRPLARALTKNLDSLRGILRDQCLRSISEYTERIQEALIIFDKLFAEFELSYVSAMVPVKTMKEYDMLQEVTILFSETVQRALKIDLLSQDMIDDYDPALMFTIPRLAIVCGLLIYPEGPLNPDMEPPNMTEMYRPFQTLLYKISVDPDLMASNSPSDLDLLFINKLYSSIIEVNRELLYTLSPGELSLLEKSLCSSEEPANQSDALLTVSSQSDNLLQVDQGFDESGEGIVPVDTIGSNILVHSPSSGSPVTPVNSDSALTSFDTISPTSTVVDGTFRASSPTSLNHIETDDAFSNLNKSESQDSGLHSENVSTSDTVIVDCAQVSLQDVDNTTSVATSGESKPQTRDITPGASANLSEVNNVKDSCEVDPSGVVLNESQSDTIKGSESDYSVTCDSSGNDDECLKSCCRIDCVSEETRHICHDIIDDLVLNAVHICDGGDSGSRPESNCDKSASTPAHCDTEPTFNTSHCDTNQSGDSSSEISSKPDCDENGSAVDGDSAAPEYTRQFSWQYNVQFAIPPFSVTDQDRRRDEMGEATGSISSDTSSTLSDSNQQNSVSEFVIETLANMTAGSDSNRSNQQVFETQATASQEQAATGSSSTNENKTEKGDLNQAAIARIDSYLDVAIAQASSKSSQTSSSGSKNQKAKPKKKEGGRGSLEHIHCRTGTQASTSLGSTVESPRVNSLKYSESVSSSCSGGGCDEKDCSCAGSETSSYNSETNDEEEIALAIQAAEQASRNEARSRFRSSGDLIHRLFVCIAGVADQLQTNYASDLRHILKCVFELNSSPDEVEEPAPEPSTETADSTENTSSPGNTLPSPQQEGVTTGSPQPGQGQGTAPSPSTRTVAAPSSPRRIFDEPPEWVPDDEVERCTACKTPFTFMRRRHHCRNCGKIFCGKCSSTTVPLPQYGHQKPVRVCHRCFLFTVSHFTLLE